MAKINDYGNLTLLSREAELLTGTANYWIVRVTAIFRTTGKETLTIRTLGSSSNSPMEAESLALKKQMEEFNG